MSTLSGEMHDENPEIEEALPLLKMSKDKFDKPP
jgi:hypothetical protein